MKSKIPDTASQSTETPNVATDEEDDDGDDTLSIVPGAENDGLNSSSSTTNSQCNRGTSDAKPVRKKTGKSTGKIESEILNQLSQRAENSRKLQSKIEEMMVEAESTSSSRVMWGRWMASMITDIHDDLWDSYMNESFKQLMWYREESKRLRKQPQVSPFSRPSQGQQLQQQSHSQFQVPYDQSFSYQRGSGQMSLPPMQQSMIQSTYHGQPYIPTSRYTSPILSWDTASTSDPGLGSAFTQTLSAQQQRQTEPQPTFIQLLDMPSTASATATTSDLAQQDTILNTSRSTNES